MSCERYEGSGWWTGEGDETVLEVYNGTAEEALYTLAYGNLAGLFVEAIKELKGELDALKKKVGV